jgi:hypothetical protein
MAAKQRKKPSTASRNRIRNCPRITQMHADGEKKNSEFIICVNLRHLRAEALLLLPQAICSAGIAPREIA